MTRRILVSLLFVALFLAAGAGVFAALLSLRKEPERGQMAPPSVFVRVQPAARTSYTEWLGGYGQARALRRAQVSAEVPGIVTWISPRLEAGSLVSGPRLADGSAPDGAAPGEVLVRLDDRDLRRAREDAAARLSQARAAVTRARAVLASVRTRLEVARRDLGLAEEELGRVERLLATGNATASERDRQRLETTLRERSVLDLEGQEAAADADVARALADEEAAVARERLAQQDLDRAAVRAPFAGRIETRRVEPGSRVAPGAALFEIVDPSRVEVAVALGASRFGEVRVGAAARLRRSEEGPDVWSGSVVRLSPVVESADRTFLVYLVVETSDGEPAPVPPGAFVVARIEGPRYEDVTPLPRTAFLGEWIYVAIPSGGADEAVVERRTPAIRRRLSDVVLLSGGVAAGESIVVTNLEQLAHGSRVRIAPPEPEGGAAPAPVGAEPR